MFPTVRSLLSPAALAALVAEQFGWTGVSCRLLKATIRDVYRVDAQQGPAVLIVYRRDRATAAGIEAELTVLDDLAARGPAHGLFVGPALRRRDGARIMALPAPEGIRFAVLFRFLEGRPLGGGADAAHLLGRAVALMHELSDATAYGNAVLAARPALDAHALVDRPLDELAELLRDRPQLLADLGGLGAAIRARLAGLPLVRPGYGLVHGDAIRTNALLRPDGTVALLDFDFCGPGWRAYDVATALRDARSSDAASGDAFLAGYQDIRPLADWELAALPVLMAARGLASLAHWGWRVREWGSSALPHALLARLVGEIVGDVEATPP